MKDRTMGNVQICDSYGVVDFGTPVLHKLAIGVRPLVFNLFFK
jgi:hypothetical protein